MERHTHTRAYSLEMVSRGIALRFIRVLQKGNFFIIYQREMEIKVRLMLNESLALSSLSLYFTFYICTCYMYLFGLRIVKHRYTPCTKIRY